MFENKPVIHLSTGNFSGALIRQLWTEDDIKQFHDCDVKVDSNLYSAELGKYRRGVFVSIPKINLRKRNNNRCLDYVQITFENAETEQMCGTYDANDEMGYGSFFNNDGGNVSIHVHIERSVPLSVNQRFLELQILLTAYDSKFLHARESLTY